LLMTARQSDGTAMRAEQVMEQMVSLIGAGHDTTASALTWALFHIHRNPAVKDRLLAELRGVAEPAAIARLPYLDAVCAETLRLCPIAPLIGRTLRSPLSVKGHLVPAGASVGISIIGLHHRADLYPEPEKFVPDRFLHRQAGRGLHVSALRRWGAPLPGRRVRASGAEAGSGRRAARTYAGTGRSRSRPRGAAEHHRVAGEEDQD